MPANEFFKLHVLANSNFNQATLIEANVVSVKPGITEPDLTKPDKIVITPDKAWFVIPFGFTMVLTIILLMSPEVWKLVRARVATFTRLHQVPCRNCRFFTNNHYLWCTVHPSTALTKEALACSDYYPQDERL
jgi:hypothetical protein